MDRTSQEIFSDFDSDKDRSGEKKTRRARKVDTNWSAERCHSLIALVESKSNLWDVAHTDYKNRNNREIAWEEISKKMNLPKDEVSNKWNLLRQQFRNAYNKVKRSKNGQAAVPRKLPNPFYNKLLFLQPILSIDSGSRTSYIVRKDSEASLSPFATSPQVVDFDQSYDDDSDPLSSPSPFQSPSSNSSSVHPKLKRRKVAETNGHCSALIKQTCDYLVNAKDEDEFELWGKSVAATLRNYPNGTAVRMAKSKMNQVMASLEAGELDGVSISSGRYAKF
ncbi:uncharacterized protein LOC117782712 isoform X1 [Drosophila innubila]|uniref:uncharacterized protein LOC117782712 isoform X1 n=1 Tax=Drosophila innubila TaxID=198719 RepID=UPI00148DA344|nr:uncharacterized protein LOC117782712 isoform X1 [Drosophila innubila]